MTDRFDEATRLKNLLGRKEAIIDREKDTRTVNHGLIERLAIERDISTAAPWLIEVAGCFRKGDAWTIKDLIERMRIDVEYFSSYTKNDVELLRRIYRSAKIMEGKECVV